MADERTEKQKVQEITDKLEEGLKELFESEKYKTYFTLRYNKKDELLSYEEKADVIQSKLELCGYFCIITSERMTAQEALIHYKACTN